MQKRSVHLPFVWSTFVWLWVWAHPCKLFYYADPCTCSIVPMYVCTHYGRNFFCGTRRTRERAPLARGFLVRAVRRWARGGVCGLCGLCRLEGEGPTLLRPACRRIGC